MAKVTVYNIEGKEVEKLELADSVFNLKRNDDLIHQVFVAISGNKRQVLAHTKNRGERAGSGIKPWRQKGTGRARIGSVRSPLWKKGGVAFGPRNDRNFEKKVNQKMNAKAIAMVLSAKLSDKELFILDNMEVKVKKTRAMAKVMDNLKISGKTLMAFSKDEKNLRMLTRNIDKVSNIMAAQLNVYDMLNNKYLIMSKDSVKMLSDKYKEKNQ